MREARNALISSQSSTPLVGGENLELEGIDFSGLAPRGSVVKTPNAFAAQLTPNRDFMAINDWEGFARPELTEEQLRRLSARKEGEQLAALLRQLPEPENEYEVEVSESEDSEYDCDAEFVEAATL